MATKLKLHGSTKASICLALLATLYWPATMPAADKTTESAKISAGQAGPSDAAEPDRTLPAIDRETQGKISQGIIQHPLDVRMDRETARYSAGSVTAGIYSDYLPLWDAEMNRVYKEWMKLLPQPEQQILRDSQRAWLQFRDANEKTIHMSVSSGSTPTMYVSFASYAVMNMTRERALELIRRMECWRELKDRQKELDHAVNGDANAKAGRK